MTPFDVMRGYSPKILDRFARSGAFQATPASSVT
jgi:hypothetical protein